MGLLSGNSCNIITILPLGLDCDSINASTPEANNGFVALYITGGTPPYNVTWDNGQQGTFLSNVGPGDYTATVVDYYGDFTATTTCNVGFDSFYLEEFENCKDNSKVYYLAEVPSSFIPESVYNLTTQNGCWISSGLTLYNTQSYINNFAVVQNGPFDDCIDCETPPPPPIVLPSSLCMSISQFDGPTLTSLQQINFSSGGTYDGYQTWTSITPSYTIYYNTGQTRWMVSGWTSSGVPNFPFPVDYPAGTWIVSGSYSKQITVVTGTCVSPPLRFFVEKDNPSCSSSNDGSITVNVQSGIPPYSYSLDGLTYQNSPNTFFGLSAGNYLVYVKDSTNAMSTLPVTLTNTSSSNIYNLNLQQIQLGGASLLTNTTSTTKKWMITVPNLPSNSTVSFTINVSSTLTAQTSPSTVTGVLSNLQNTITGTTNGTSTLSTPTISGLVTQTLPRLECEGGLTHTTAFTQTYQATITNGGQINITNILKIFTPVSLDKRCPANGTIKNTITLTNVSITPLNCQTIINNTTPNTIEISRTGNVNDNN
jgi:hypothetical protein